jgi:hypothetical protein
MHTLSPNFQEDMKFLKVIIFKPDSAKFACLEFLKIYILEDHVIENILFWECDLIPFHLIMKNYRLSLMVHTISNLIIMKFKFDF